MTGDVGLTEPERKVINLLVEAYNTTVREIIGYSPSRQGDLAEFAAKIHDLQHMIMAQAAARAHPYWYRLLGEQVKPPPSIGLCGNREEHSPHVVVDSTVGPFICSADQSTRLPYAAERARKEKDNDGSTGTDPADQAAGSPEAS